MPVVSVPDECPTYEIAVGTSFLLLPLPPLFLHHVDAMKSITQCCESHQSANLLLSFAVCWSVLACLVNLAHLAESSSPA